MIFDIVKAAVLLFVAAILQVTFVNTFELVEGHADIVLLALIGIALLRGPIFGACAGFYAGLVLDTATLATLGLTALLLTLAGYAAGRFGEATSQHQNQRARILLAVTAITVAVGLLALVVNTLLGESVSADLVFGRVLLPTLAINLVLALPAYWVIRKLFPPPARREREREVAVV